MTPQPRYARWVGVPILILTGLWMLASFLLTITVPAANEAVHGGWLALGLVGIPIVFLVLTLIWAIHARRSDRRQQR